MFIQNSHCTARATCSDPDGFSGHSACWHSIPIMQRSINGHAFGKACKVKLFGWDDVQIEKQKVSNMGLSKTASSRSLATCTTNVNWLAALLYTLAAGHAAGLPP